MSDIKMTTRGEWIVTQLKDGRIAVVALMEDGKQKTLAVMDGINNEALANAALMAVSGRMLETLIAIQDSLAEKMIDIDGIMEMINGEGGVFSQLANEAGE